MADSMILPNQINTLRSTFELMSMLQRGFTTIRNTGGASKFIVNAWDEGLLVGPRFFQWAKALS